jgi:hypothetical protein
MPTKDGAIHLPLFSKKWAYLAYCKDNIILAKMLPSYSYFTKVWRERKALLGKIKTQRKVGTLSRCGKCRVLQRQIHACRGDDQGTRDRLEAKYKGHLILQNFERRFYAHKKNLAISEPNNFLSCIVDSSSQYVYNCPYAKSTYKGADPGSNLPQSLTAVYFHGRKFFIYPKSKNIAGGTNWTLHCLMSSLEQLVKESDGQPLPKTLFIQLDNCSGENKNKFVFAFLSSLVTKGMFDSIVVSFLPVGHTHEDVDQVFSQMVHLLADNPLTLSLDEFDELLLKLARRTTKFPCEIIRKKAMLDYKKYITPYILPGVRGHKKPHCFAFVAEEESGLRSCKMRYREFSVSESWFPEPILRDGIIHPDDVYAARMDEEDEENVNDDELLSEIEDDFSRRQQDRIHEAAEAYYNKTGLSQLKDPDERAKRQSRKRRLDMDSDTENLNPPKVTFVDPASVLLNRSTILYSGQGFLRHETDISKKSFMASPGLSFSSRITPELDTLECAPVICFSEEDLAKYRVGCSAFVRASASFYNEASSERVKLALDSWDLYFDVNYVHSMADLTPSNYQIDWSCLIRPQEKIGIDSFPVASNTALDLMLNYTEGLDFQGGGDAILHNESKSNEAKARTFQDLASLGHTRKSIEVNQFLVCLRDKDDVVQKGKGFTPEEEALPFFLAKSTCDVPEGCHPTTVVEIIYWRQTEGNPNKHFIEGQFINPKDSLGSGAHVWTGSVRRNEVLYVDPGFKKNTGRSRTFDQQTLMELASLHNPQLRGWVYEAKVGLVFRQPIAQIDIGDFFIVDWKATPQFLLDEHKIRLKSAGVVVIKSNVRVDDASGGVETKTVPDVSWFFFDKDDLNLKFKPFLTTSRGRGKQRVLGGQEVRSEVKVSSIFQIISPLEAVGKKLDNDSKKKLIESNFFSVRSVWVWDIEKKKLLPKISAKKK